MRNFTGSVSNITSQIFAANNGGNAPPVSDVTALVAAANSSSPNAPTGAIAAALARRDLRGGKNKVLHTIAAIIKDDLVKVSGSIVKQGNVSNWGLTRISSRINNIDTSTDYTYDSTGGKGVTIFVVDTGVETNNPEFEGRAIPGREFCTGCPPVKSAEDTLHGTAVAAIAASKTYGVAKKAKIVSVRAMSGEGYGRWSDVIAALQWIKANANRSPYRSSLGAIVNLSIEGPVNGVVNRMIAQVQRAGIQVVIAAGNNAEDACITSPASATAMFDGNNGPISVAASDATDSMAYFTNFGSCVDVIAPGDSVTTIYDMVVSGTSFAAPAVAGTMALYMSANPWLGTPSMRAWIRYRATKDLIQGTTSDTPNLLLYNTLQGK
ncbi:peptidase S8/S53 domain-containing protein [Blastocladiella britannica]|nr:peptidase S8/S53 domain-containing protein [Blastocladiella britannica]